MLTHTLFKSYQCPQGTIGVNTPVNGDAEINLDYTWIASGGVDPIGSGAPSGKEIDLAFTASKVKCMVINSTVDLTHLRQNNNSTGVDDTTIKAGVAKILATTAEVVAYFTDSSGVISKLFITSAATDGTFQVRALVDIT